MKPLTVKSFFNLNNHYKCESQLSSGSPPLRLWPWSFLCRVRILWITKTRFVLHPLRDGLHASLASLWLLLSNKRHIVGLVLLVVGAVQIFAGQIVSDPYSEPHDVCRFLQFTTEQCVKDSGWCYVSWFYYLETVRMPIALIVWSVAGILFIPIRYSLAFIPFALFNAAGWIWLIHYSFFTHSYDTYHMFPYWQIIALGVFLGFGVVMTADHLLYWYNHRYLASEKRLLTLYNGADLLDDATFKAKFKQFVEEKKAFQKSI